MNKITLTLVFTLSSFLLTFVPSADAATRKVYFSVVGRNSVTSTAGLKDPQTSQCIISVTNSSATVQDVVVSFDGSKTTGVGAAGPVTGNTNNMANMAANASDSVEYPFTEFPINTTGEQTITCSGYITATDDVAASPGFVTANGTLISFIESAQGSSTTASGGSSSYTSTAVFTQTPIPINGGKPF